MPGLLWRRVLEWYEEEGEKEKLTVLVGRSSVPMDPCVSGVPSLLLLLVTFYEVLVLEDSADLSRLERLDSAEGDGGQAFPGPSASSSVQAQSLPGQIDRSLETVNRLSQVGTVEDLGRHFRGSRDVAARELGGGEESQQATHFALSTCRVVYPRSG